MVDNILFIAALLGILTITYSYYARTLAPPNPPNTPSTVPYLIPWLGSFFAFNRDPLRFLQAANQRHGKFYKIYAAGRAVVVISDPDTVAVISRDTNNHLDHQDVFKLMLRGIAGLGSSLDLIMDLLDGKIFPLVKAELSPATMSQVTATTDVRLPRELNALAPTSHSITLNLSEVVGRPIYNAGSRALFGPTFPLDSYNDFLELDSHLPQLLTQLPFIAQRGRRSRARMVSTLEKFIELWWDSDGTEDIPEVSVAVMQSLIELKASQVSKQDAAGTLLLVLWGFNSNMWYITSWLVTHLLVDNASMARILEDINVFRSKHSLDQLDDPECMPPLLESGIQEAFRWATTSTTARYTTEDTVVIVEGAPVPIFKGEWVIADTRAVHHNPDVYADPYEFKIDRYLVNSKNILPVPKPLPWGRGKHMCPGRHVAGHIMRRFAVELLSIYTIKPAGLPTNKLALPPISQRHFLGSLKSAEDIPVTLTRRTHLGDLS